MPTTAAAVATAPRYRCFVCRRPLAVEVGRSRCDCGGVLDLDDVPPLRRAPGQSTPAARTWLSGAATDAADLGTGTTPLLRWPGAQDVWLKCDHLLPTGSFKDRGAHMLAALAWQLAAPEVVTDSSGNAAAALAAHAARAGLACRVFVPAGTSPGKLRQILAYGAVLTEVPGPREAAARAASDYAAATGAMYASHSLNPFFVDGTKRWVYEVLAEQPETATVVLPVGSGSLLLGVLRGLRELRSSGWLDRTPRLVLAQAAGYAPLARGRAESMTGEPPTDSAQRSPLAEGIAIARPVRLDQMLDQLEDFPVEVRVVTASEIARGHAELARHGFYVEPTSAAAWAAWRRGPESADTTVVALTGHGLKAA